MSNDHLAAAARAMHSAATSERIEFVLKDRWADYVLQPTDSWMSSRFLCSIQASWECLAAC